MITCPNCGKTHNNTANFCDACGSRLETPATPNVSAPVYVPVYQPSVKNIPGMIMSAVGMGLSIFASIYFFFGFVIFGIDEMLRVGAPFFVFSLVFSLIAIPFSVVGLTMSAKRINYGSTHKTATLGKTFGVVATIMSCAMAFVSFLVIVSAL